MAERRLVRALGFAGIRRVASSCCDAPGMSSSIWSMYRGTRSPSFESGMYGGGRWHGPGAGNAARRARRRNEAARTT